MEGHRAASAKRRRGEKGSHDKKAGERANVEAARVGGVKRGSGPPREEVGERQPHREKVGSELCGSQRSRRRESQHKGWGE